MHHVYSQADSDRSRTRRLRRPVPGCAAGRASIKPDDASALLVIDVQNCFLPGGSLAVKDGDEVVPVINRVAKAFANVVLTQDWHTAGPCLVRLARMPARSRSRPSSCPTASRCCGPTTACRAPRAPRCQRISTLPHAQLVIRKGFHKEVDSYSAFTEADGKTTTGLAGYLKARRSSACSSPASPPTSASHGRRIDARKAGFETYVIEDACRGIDTQGSLAKAWADMTKAGVKRIQSADIAA